jgi:trehalose 6-phosphate synthase
MSPAGAGRSGPALAIVAGKDRGEPEGRLIVVSNRIGDVSASRATGGLAVAVGEALRATGGIWFGWSGEVGRAANLQRPQMRKTGAVRLVTTALTPEEHQEFYLGFANGCLWPLFHYRLDLADLRAGLEASYLAVNERFAREVAALVEPADTLWVHDYQLIACGAYLRQRRVTNPIGFFLHIPFPSTEIVAALPNHRAFMRTLFAYDLIGFQTVRDRENFARYAVEHLECRRLNDGRLKGFGRTVAIEAFPIGIDAEAFAAQARANADLPELQSLTRVAEGKYLVVGVDRLDYSKGLPERIRGIEAFLSEAPDYRGRVQFLQVAPPTRESVGAYKAIRGELERMTGHANGRFGDLGWSPIRYVHKAVRRPVLAGLFRRCRVGLVTPLRDGMNLVAKEYVAAQDPEDPGVLVLSQFAGAAEQMEEALIVNPHDTASLGVAIRRAIEMPLGERRARQRALWKRVAEEDVGWWRERFLSTLARSHAAQPAGTVGSASQTVAETLKYGEKPDQAAC